MVMSVSLQPSQENTREAFQSLSLSIPIDTAKYQYICQFLDRVLSLKDERAILGDYSDQQQANIKYGYVELLPNVSFPLDAWVNDQLVFRDIKIKTSVLHEINSLIERELANTQSGTPVRIDGNVISYYEKLLVAYKFLEAPIIAINTSPTNSASYNSRTDFPLREEDDEEVVDSSIARTISNQSSTNSLSKTYHSLFGNGSSNTTSNSISSYNGAGTNSNHNSLNLGNGNGNIYNNSNHNNTNNNTFGGVSNGNAYNNTNTNSNNSNGTNANNTNSSNSGSRLTFSRKKRFSTLLGQSGNNSDSNLNDSNGHNNSGYGAEEEEKKQQHLNGLLNKSRIYNKLKKNRESSASATSVISNPTSLSHSNRNSITTTMTSGSKRRGSIQTPDMLSEARSSVIFGGGSSMNGGSTFISSRHSSMYSIPGLTPSQKQEIQKNKYEYYTQLKKLLRLTKQVLAVINDSVDSRDLINLVEFIKRYVIKFIVIDMNEILLEYVEYKELSLYRK